MLSIWERTSFHREPQLVVIGSGIVGLFTALFHQRRHPHHDVLVLERGPHPIGASARNAGFACFGSPSELLADIGREGEAAALARVEERYQGLRELRAELGDAAIGFEPTGGHELFRMDDALYPQVAESFDWLNALLAPITGPGNFQWADHLIAEQGLQGVAHLARTRLEGAVDSGLLMRALLRKAAEAGVRVQWQAEVSALEEGPAGVELALRNGERLRAGQVVVATNGFTPALLPQLDVVPGRGQVLLTEPVPGLRLRGTFHMDEGYFYFRDLGGAVLLGGGRHLDLEGERTMQDGLTTVIQTALEHLLRTVILPGQEVRIVARWSGTMAFGSAGKQPLVERISDRIAVAVRLGGMGVAIGIRVARKAADLLG